MTGIKLICQLICEIVLMLFDIFVPRFMTETVFLDEIKGTGELYIVSFVEPPKYASKVKYKFKGTARGFNFLGTLYFIKIVEIYDK